MDHDFIIDFESASMKIRKLIFLAVPVLMLTTAASSAFSAGSKSAVAAHGGEVALAITSEIVTPIVAEQIMQAFGISSGSAGIDYDRIGEIVRDIVRDENKKQTMARLLSQLGGANKSVETILTLARTDTPEAGIESLNDTNIREKIIRTDDGRKGRIEEGHGGQAANL